MSQEVLVKVDNVSKRFCRSLKRSLWYGLQDLGSELGGRRHGGVVGLPQSSSDVELRKDEFWAVKDVSFKVRRGECLALVGRNGAGKTTLLKMLNGLIKPDTGRIEMSGNVGGIISLGAGFNPILTGRENILINAGIYGLTEGEAIRALPKIEDFSEIGEFLDAPVSSYSSGMTVRLGFATAIYALRPDVLILDEVLAVGDEAFRSKCLLAVSDLLTNSAAIFVSHSMPDVARISSQALWLHNGSVAHLGSTAKIVHDYTESFSKKGSPLATETREDIVSSFLVESHGCCLGFGDDLLFSVSFNYKRDSGNASLMVGLIYNDSLVAQSVTSIDASPGINKIRFCLKELLLSPGTYVVNINLLSHDRRHHYARTTSAFKFTIAHQESSFISAANSRYAPKLSVIKS